MKFKLIVTPIVTIFVYCVLIHMKYLYEQSDKSKLEKQNKLFGAIFASILCALCMAPIPGFYFLGIVIVYCMNINNGFNMTTGECINNDCYRANVGCYDPMFGRCSGMGVVSLVVGGGTKFNNSDVFNGSNDNVVSKF